MLTLDAFGFVDAKMIPSVVDTFAEKCLVDEDIVGVEVVRLCLVDTTVGRLQVVVALDVVRRRLVVVEGRLDVAVQRSSDTPPLRRLVVGRRPSHVVPTIEVGWVRRPTLGALLVAVVTEYARLPSLTKTPTRNGRRQSVEVGTV